MQVYDYGVRMKKNVLLSIFLCILGLIVVLGLFKTLMQLSENDKIRHNKLMKLHEKGHVWGNWHNVDREPYLYHKCIVCGWLEAKPISVIEDK